MKEVLALLQNAQANLTELADDLSESEVVADDLNSYLEVKGRLGQAIAILEAAEAQGVLW